MSNITTIRSGGPKTDAGKARSSQNALKHGMTSNKMYILQNENPEAWAQLLAECVAGYRPATPLEHTYVEAIAFALWRLNRIYAVQTALIDMEMDSQAEEFSNTYEEADETVRKALAMRSLLENEQALSRLSRYETSLQRAHDRAVKNLRILREMSNPTPLPQAVNLETLPSRPLNEKLRNELSPKPEAVRQILDSSEESTAVVNHAVQEPGSQAAKSGIYLSPGVRC